MITSQKDELTPKNVNESKLLLSRIKKHKKLNSEKQGLNKTTMCFRTSNKKDDLSNFDGTYQRFQSKMFDYEVKLETLRAKQKEKELKQLQSTPQINKNTNNLVKTNKSFLERQKAYEDQKKEKNAKKLEEKKKKEDEEMKKNNVSNKSNVKMNNRESLQRHITSFKEWEEKRKEKINNLKKAQEAKEMEEILKYQKKNKLNKKITQEELDNQLERLYTNDVIKRKENQNLLKSIFTPSFQPQINKKPKEKNETTKTEISKVEKEEKEKEEEEEDINIVETEYYLTQQNDKEIHDVLRDKLFKSKKNGNKKKMGKLYSFTGELNED